MHARSLILSASLLLAAAPATILAQSAPVTPIERANADAVARLYAKIAAEDVAGVPVAQIVDRVDGYSILMNGLGRAEQIGGPREVASGVVQVRLQISGARAGQLVLQAVAARPDESPVSVDRLAFHLRQWNDRTFIGTGDNLEPSVVAADVDASAAPATTRPMVEVAEAGATTRPIVAHRGLPGRSMAPARPAEQPAKWRAAPAWVNEPLVASATADSVGSPLRTARAAEQAAREALHAKLRDLPAIDDPSGKLGDDLANRPETLAALDEAVTAARVSNVDYRADGSVHVQISVGGQRLWQRLAVGR